LLIFSIDVFDQKYSLKILINLCGFTLHTIMTSKHTIPAILQFNYSSKTCFPNSKMNIKRCHFVFANQFLIFSSECLCTNQECKRRLKQSDTLFCSQIHWRKIYLWLISENAGKIRGCSFLFGVLMFFFHEPANRIVDLLLCVVL
jgi:hypothetical protein